MKIGMLNKFKSSNVARLYQIVQDRQSYFFPTSSGKDKQIRTVFYAVFLALIFPSSLLLSSFSHCYLLNITKLIFSGLNVLAQLQTMNSRNLPVHTNQVMQTSYCPQNPKSYLIPQVPSYNDCLPLTAWNWSDCAANCLIPL